MPQSLVKVLFSSTGIISITAGIIYLLVACYLHTASSHDPSSAFFQPHIAFEPHYSVVRQRQAEDFIEHVTEGGRNTTYEPLLCVGIASVQRGERYFRAAIGSLLAGLSDEERDQLHLTVLIANSSPRDHPAYNEKWLQAVSDKILTYEDVPDEQRAEILRLEQEDTEHRVKTLLDYSHVLESCAATKAEFVLMLEDDIVAADGWYHRTAAALEKWRAHKDSDRSLYMRLFYSSKLLGWNSEEWTSYLLWSLSVTIGVAIILYTMQRYHKPCAKILTIRMAAAVVFVYIPACILLFFAAGRLTVAPLAPGLQPMDRFGCCSQALVYPREQIPGLLDFYQERGIGFVDVLTEDYANLHNLRRWALVPSIIQHVGARSSKEGDDQDSKWHRSAAANIWNFDFEHFDGDALHKEHMEAMMF